MQPITNVQVSSATNKIQNYIFSIFTSSIGFLYDYPNFSHFFVRQRNSGKPSLRLSRLLNLILYATTDQAIHSFPSGQLITKDRTSSAVNVEKTIQQTSKVGKMSIVLTNTAHIAARG